MYLKSDMGQTLLKQQLVQGTAMPQISTNELKQFKVPILNDIQKLNIINNFNTEISKYREIYHLQDQINKINSNFLK